MSKVTKYQSNSYSKSFSISNFRLETSSKSSKYKYMCRKYSVVNNFFYQALFNVSILTIVVVSSLLIHMLYFVDFFCTETLT